jgi:phenylalanyl-tRNA synthetase alpha chain
MTPDQRKSNGPLFNTLRDRVAAAIAARKTLLEEEGLDARLAFERVDITLPARPEAVGTVHPVSQVLDEVAAIFADLGFAIAEGPDVEFDDYNFTKLNIPPDHPARQMHDTFYVAKQADGSRHVLRTHTSPVQVRTMLKQKPPIRIISPGRTYRVDSDATHSPMFHQFEGLVIDEATHLGHLKWVLEEFCKSFFEVDRVEMRARPSFFPFTEPSVEWDLRCDRSGGQIKFGQGNDWLELAGSGMVNPRVLENCGIDSTRYQGYAFGGGIDRLAMLKYGIPDIRSFFESDLRWLRHFGFAALDIPTLDGGLSR